MLAAAPWTEACALQSGLPLSWHCSNMSHFSHRYSTACWFPTPSSFTIVPIIHIKHLTHDTQALVTSGYVSGYCWLLAQLADPGHVTTGCRRTQQSYLCKVQAQPMGVTAAVAATTPTSEQPKSAAHTPLQSSELTRCHCCNNQDTACVIVDITPM